MRTVSPLLACCSKSLSPSEIADGFEAKRFEPLWTIIYRTEDYVAMTRYGEIYFTPELWAKQLVRLNRSASSGKGDSERGGEGD
jgi:hypothetical protein